MSWTVEINYQHDSYTKFFTKVQIESVVSEACRLFNISFGGYFLFNIVNEEMMSKINKEYYPFQKLSNVLTFPFHKNVESSNFYNPLGEIFFCLPKVQKQSNNSDKLFLRNALNLFLHSFLHLLGFDHTHAKDEWLMEEFHKHIWAKLSLKSNYD